MFLLVTLFICQYFLMAIPTMANTDTKWCDDLGTFLSFEQVNFCKKNFKVMDFLSSGGELALRHCQRVMKYERWLCADDTSKFVGDKKLYYILNEGITPESAFLSAIRAAGMYYALMDAYKQKSLECPQKNRRNFGYCNTAVAKVVEEFLKFDILPIGTDVKLVTKHNSRLGMAVVFELMQQYPERVDNDHYCCGTYPLPPFSIVADSLYETYVNKSYKASRKINGGILKLENNTVAQQHALLYYYDSKSRCPRPTWSVGQICYSGEGDKNLVAAVRQCEKYCCRNTCIKRVIEQQEIKFCKMSRRCCAEPCEVTVKNVTNFYCC